MHDPREPEDGTGAAGGPAGTGEAGETGEIGVWLRQALEPGPEVTGRIVRVALQGQEQAGGAGTTRAGAPPTVLRVQGSPAGTRQEGGPLAGRPETGRPRARATPLRRPVLPSAAGALAAALLLAAGLWLSFGRLPARPGGEPAAVSITNVGGIVVVRAGGRTRLVRTDGSPAAGSPEPAGELFIRYGGGQ
jgi:hypothetical protein